MKTWKEKTAGARRMEETRATTGSDGSHLGTARDQLPIIRENDSGRRLRSVLPDDDIPAIHARSETGGIMAAGFALALIVFGGFGTWAAMAPLKGAVIAAGIVKVRGDRKEVEHLEGGILREALVVDGQRVKAGQVLFRLDDTRLLASRKLLEARLLSAEAQRARLEAEKANEPNLRIAQPDDPALASIVGAQHVLFTARKARHNGQMQLLDERIGLVRQEINAHDAQMTSERNQLAYLREEIGDATYLMNKGLQRKPRFLALKRQFESIDGQIKQRAAMIARAQQEINRTEQEKAQLGRQREDEIARESREVTDKIVEVSQQLAIVSEQLERTQVRAPVDGTVVGVGTKSAGAVISPGERLLEIVPGDMSLVVEARIALNDIENVQPGAKARIRLSAYNARRTSPVDGELLLVSADRLEDQRTGNAFFRAELSMDPTSLAAGHLTVVPGMAADVLIETREMTLLDYLLGPLLAAVDKAMRDR